MMRLCNTVKNRATYNIKIFAYITCTSISTINAACDIFENLYVEYQPELF
jgi:hypothetical protein